MSVAKNLRIDSYFKAKGCILCDRLNLIQWTYDACENRTWKLLLFESRSYYPVLLVLTADCNHTRW